MFPVGAVVLFIIAGLILLGLGHRVLDRMRLSDRAALAVIAAILVGSFIDLPLASRPVRLSLNIGGGLIPLALAVYLLVRAGTNRERLRALLAGGLAAAVIFLINTRLMGADPWQTGRELIDPLYVYPLVAGGLAYLVGRSRRAAFVAAILSVLILDVADFIRLAAAGTPGAVAFGGAGALDVMVLSAVIAVLLAEIVGEIRERLQGGPDSRGRPEELVAGLRGVGGPVGEPARKILERGPEEAKGGSRDDGQERDEQ